MSTSENRRTTMTKKMLQNSLIEILEKKPIHEITIKEICDNADINRSTFYRHYNTPNQLFDEIYDNVNREILTIANQFKDQAFNSADVLTKILLYCEENRKLCLVLLSENGELKIGKSFSERVTQAVLTTAETVPSELHMYVVQFIAAGMANFIWTWLHNENRLPARTVARGMTMLIKHGFNRALSLSVNPENRAFVAQNNSK